eukprot:SAG11_NODE_3503_length_2407_cov_6.188908_1_plen_44_part_10
MRERVTHGGRNGRLWLWCDWHLDVHSNLLRHRPLLSDNTVGRRE